MKNLIEAIDRISILECPTGELEEHIINILEDYRVANRNYIIISRHKERDKGDIKAYKIEFTNNKEQSFIILTKVGMDGYVVKVLKVIY